LPEDAALRATFHRAWSIYAMATIYLIIHLILDPVRFFLLSAPVAQRFRTSRNIEASPDIPLCFLWLSGFTLYLRAAKGEPASVGEQTHRSLFRFTPQLG